jgi:mono/diheme cytochrome c family protein
MSISLSEKGALIVRKPRLRRWSLSLLLLLPAAALAQSAKEEAGVEFFEQKVRPILANHCYQCHSADTKPAGGLRVDDRNGLLLGGDAGAAVVPGSPEKSLVLQRIQHANPKRRMPKEGELLTDAEVADLTTWIRDGAAWPRERIPGSIGRTKPAYEDLKAKHWAWQPLANPAAPGVQQTGWAEGPIDQFILATLEAKKLPPVADADPATLLRRVTYDLTGLPPTPTDLAAFTQDSSPAAYARVVDRLLASPQFGERWGRHWLDVARYGESTGPSRNIPYPHAWKYRDYVLDAINRDVPYDRFIQEQIAGDLLPAANPQERDRLLTATGFLALGVKDVNQRFKTRFIMDNVDEKIDVVTRSVLGLTVSCARCHDHKFDPIPVTDYYALAGIFTSTEDCSGLRNKMGGGGLEYYVPSQLVRLSDTLPPPPPEKLQKLEADVAEAKKAWDEIRGTPEGLKRAPDGKPTQRPFRVKYEKLQGELLALTDPAARGAAVHGVRESSAIADTEVRIRGEAERLGPTVPRGFLTTFAVPDAAPVNPAQSGRLELARWLTSAKNPLASRVLVNRVWHQLFGTGLVSTVDNFGVKGDVPSHPELLDYLAGQFIRDGWSLKRLVRSVVTSHAYRLGSDAPTLHRELDPANRLVWRHSPRRLDAEEVRDTMLAVAGRLAGNAPADSAVRALRMVEIRDNGAEARSVYDESDRSVQRSIYLPLLRGVIPKALEAFDPVTQSLVTGQREATTVPTQALYLLNSSFVRQQSLALAERLLAKPNRPPGDGIREAYLLALGRAPSPQEAARAEAFLADFAASASRDFAPVVPAATFASASPVDSTEPAAGEAKSGEAPAGGGADPKPVVVVPDNPDDVARASEIAPDAPVQPKTAQAAAWLSFIQSLFSSAEFRFVR